VNDANPPHSAAASFFEVIFNHRANLPGRNRVEVEHIAELDYDGLRKGAVRIKRFIIY
jgi:hypothetical protein